MRRLNFWLLLGLTLFAVCYPNVLASGDVDAGPTESECRPYIEKAINELKTADPNEKENVPSVDPDRPIQDSASNEAERNKDDDTNSGDEEMQQDQPADVTVEEPEFVQDLRSAADLDGDGIPNEEDSDMDGDVIPNEDDEDMDGDGIVNIQDNDFDGDIIPNEQDTDMDGDGVLNVHDSDMDGDGVKDVSDNDFDGDGIPNDEDNDMDGDGIPNDQDDDIDGDGIPNDQDDDIDGDGIPNDQDSDIDGDGVPNDEDNDMDGDGIPNHEDEDIDGDGILNGQDDDIDGDGIPNDEDDDIDGDGIPNHEDDDIDGDGIPNDQDTDIDGDGIPNDEDTDIDGDGIPNHQDSDMDGDGIPNDQDSDIDGDGISNEKDADIDGDGIPNDQDDDIDGDGIPNQEDGDLDGDGIPNEHDGDIDGDGISNERDDDIDGDGIANADDEDLDGDGIVNRVDVDLDGDGITNRDDEDLDGDGVPNVQDNDIDSDGIPNEKDDDFLADADQDSNGGDDDAKLVQKEDVEQNIDTESTSDKLDEAVEVESVQRKKRSLDDEETAKREEIKDDSKEEDKEKIVNLSEESTLPASLPKSVEHPEKSGSGVIEKGEPTEMETEPLNPDETVESKLEETEEETEPEDELLWEGEIPEILRSRQHITELLQLDDEFNAKEKAVDRVAEIILRDIKRIYENAIKPLETLYKYRDLSNRHFSDPEIFSKPLVLFMGPWSGGKSTIINYLTGNEYTSDSLRTGAEPSPAYFNILMWGNETEVLDGTQLAADYTFSGLQKFGQGLEDRLRGLKLPSKLLEKVNIVEIPGILEVRKQVSRLFPFNDACQWFIDRADIIILVYDPAKLDVGPETEAILDQLKGREYQTRILLNKADTVKPEELLRVQSALIWNISPLMSSAQPPLVYTTSLWSHPYQSGSPARLLLAQERALLRDMRTAIDKRIEHKIASARRFAVRVRNHAKMVDCYLNTYYNHKTLFGNKKRIADNIITHPENYHIYEGLSTLTNISRYDLPDPEVYRDFFRLNPLYEFKKLTETCTYFRGCPISKLDVAIAYDLPELAGKYKKMAEAALVSIDGKQAGGVGTGSLKAQGIYS